MANTGKDYEKFVANLQQALLNSEKLTTQKNIEVELNKVIADNCGINREFDLYWEYELGGITYKTIIECKDYNSDISVEKIDSLIGKIRDIPDLKPVFATKKGYQSGAVKKANNNKIELLIVREQNDSDWTDEFGNPFIKEIGINLDIVMPARIHAFQPVIDGNWVEKNTNLDISELKNITGLTNEILIEDLSMGEKYSLHDLEGRLSLQADKVRSTNTIEEKVVFENAYLHHNNMKLKLSGYKIEYTIPKPQKQIIEIDFSKEMIGVIEYLQKGSKTSIYKDGIVAKKNQDTHKLI